MLMLTSREIIAFFWQNKKLHLMFFLASPWSLARILIGRRDITSIYTVLVVRIKFRWLFGCMFRDVYIRHWSFSGKCIGIQRVKYAFKY